MSEKNKYVNDIAISTRIRLARNVMSLPFPARASDEITAEVNEQVKHALLGNEALAGYGFHYTDLDNLTEQQRLSFVERHLISPDLGKYSNAGVVINEDQTLSIMINEEDHIRLQCILPGFTLHEAFDIANEIDEMIQQTVDYAFNDKYGFATCCPTNLGTAMRAGVMLHIPAIILKSELGIIVSMANKYGLAVRGIYGEGSSALGDLFQISNQNSLGLSEDEIIKNIHAVTKEIIKMERSARNNLLIENEDQLKDSISRAYGILTNAHMITTKEAMKLLSLLRMGVDINIIENIPVDILNQLMINIQPATLALEHSAVGDVKSREIRRAEYIKDMLYNKKLMED